MGLSLGQRACVSCIGASGRAACVCIRLSPVDDGRRVGPRTWFACRMCRFLGFVVEKIVSSGACFRMEF